MNNLFDKSSRLLTQKFNYIQWKKKQSTNYLNNITWYHHWKSSFLFGKYWAEIKFFFNDSSFFSIFSFELVKCDLCTYQRMKFPVEIGSLLTVKVKSDKIHVDVEWHYMLYSLNESGTILCLWWLMYKCSRRSAVNKFEFRISFRVHLCLLWIQIYRIDICSHTSISIDFNDVERQTLFLSSCTLFILSFVNLCWKKSFYLFSPVNILKFIYIVFCIKYKQISTTYHEVCSGCLCIDFSFYTNIYIDIVVEWWRTFRETENKMKIYFV